ncbi:MAG: hypothetical protein PHI98_01220 [Eubacteriales bacterium]|nr:hypothetical protein [Eubacteriales bacterium]
MIDVKETSRELIVINIRPTRDDPMYMGCLWMTVYVDTAAWRLTVDSDCGAYVHCWPNEDKLHTFRKALAGYLMDEDYILKKISDCTEFDIEGTTGAIEDAFEDEPDVLEELLEKMKHVRSNGDFYEAFNEEAMPPDMYEYVRYDYPCQAKRVVHLLKEYVAPMLRKEA